jgi:hypothetical protein
LLLARVLTRAAFLARRDAIVLSAMQDDARKASFVMPRGIE